MKSYTEIQLTEMSKEAEAIADLLKSVEQLLKDEQEGQVPVLESNIIRMDKKILTEFEQRKIEPLQMHEVLKIYHDWAWRTYFVVQGNQGRLKKGKLREHALELFAVISTIKQILAHTGGSPDDAPKSD